MTETVVAFTLEEAEAIYDLICNLSGGNPEYAFGWGSGDTLDNVHDRACAKLYKACGKRVPKSCEGVELK